MVLPCLVLDSAQGDSDPWQRQRRKVHRKGARDGRERKPVWIFGYIVVGFVTNLPGVFNAFFEFSQHTIRRILFSFRRFKQQCPLPRRNRGNVSFARGWPKEMPNFVQNAGDTGRIAWIHPSSAAIENIIMEIIPLERAITTSGMGTTVILRVHDADSIMHRHISEAARREAKVPKGVEGKEP